MYRTWHLFDTCPVPKNPVDWIISPVEVISTVPLRRTGVSNLASIISLVTCKSRAILTRIIRSPYITNADSRLFDSPAERRFFEDFAGVSGNRCMKHGSSVSNEVTTGTDSRHFDSPAERRHFEDVAGVSGNRYIKHGSSSTVVDWQTTVGVFFQDPDISKKYLSFRGVARN